MLAQGRPIGFMIHVYPNSSYLREQTRDNQQIPNGPVEITTATSITPSGKLWNITVNSDKEIFYLDNGNLTHKTSYNSPYTIEMEVKPIKGITPGNYTLTVGARYDTVSYSKIIDLIVTK